MWKRVIISKSEFLSKLWSKTKTQESASPPSVVEKTTEVSKTIETSLSFSDGSKIRIVGLIGLVMLLISGAIPWLTTFSLFDAYGLTSNLSASRIPQNTPIPHALSAVSMLMLLTLVFYPLSVIVAVFGVAVNRVNLNNVAGVLAIIASIFWISGVEILKANLANLGFLSFLSFGVWIGSGTYLAIVAGIILITTRFVAKTKVPS